MKIGNGEQKLQECEEIKRRSMISVSEYGKETTRWSINEKVRGNIID